MDVVLYGPWSFGVIVKGNDVRRIDLCMYNTPTGVQT